MLGRLYLTMDFSIPINSDLCKAYMDRFTPDYLSVTVIRAHLGDSYNTDFVYEWRGQAQSYSVSTDWFTIQTVSTLQAKILGVTSTVFYQYGCNNLVYDSICKANKAAHTVSATVTRIDNVDIRVNSMVYPDGELALGIMQVDRTLEERSIVSNVSGRLVVSYPFLDIKVGDTVKLIQGCDNKMVTCVGRFNNVTNFTGFRFIPTDNPMGGRS